MGDKLIAVHAAPNLPTAEMIKEYLEGEGIAAVLRSRLPSFMGSDMVEILVASEREADARQALEAFLEGVPEDWPEPDK
jgi:hypothetical protein